MPAPGAVTSRSHRGPVSDTVLAVSTERSKRLRSALELGCVVWLVESAAAAFLGVREPLYFVSQLAVLIPAFLVLGIAPLRAPWPAAAVLVGVGWLHLRNVGLESFGPAGATALSVYLVHAALVGGACAWAARGERRPGAGAFAAAYSVQAFGCAFLLLPIERSAHPEWLLPIGLGAATLAPALALLLAARASRPWVRVAGVGALAAIPFLLYRPVDRAAHARLAPPAVPAPAAPDVILIVMDAARADRFGLYGHHRPTSPHLEELARTATVYERAWSQGTWTLPGHASLFTGLFLAEHGADNLRDGRTRPLDPRATTLAETFRGAGYRTACVAANANMFGDHFGLTQGFEAKWAETGLTRHLWIPWLAGTVAHALGGHSARQRIGPLERDEFAPAREVNVLALEWLDRTEGPRFLFLNFMETHGQLRREPCDAPRFGDGRAWGDFDVPNAGRVMAGEEDPDPEWSARVRDWYDSQIACLDLHLGELFDALRERGLFERSWIVVTSDHGQMLGENRSFHHRSEVWDGLVHVPLVVKRPEQESGARCPDPVTTAALGRRLPALAGIEGGGAPSDEPCALTASAPLAISETRGTWQLARRHPERWDRDWLAVHDGRVKFVRDSRGAEWIAEPAESIGEVLRAPSDEERARFDALIREWSGALAPLPVPTEDDDPSTADELRRAALKRLGYVDG